jgi:hypothetical protein
MTDWDRIQAERAAEKRSRFSPVMWIGVALLILAVGSIGALAFGEALGIVPPSPTPTPRQFATPLPPPDPTPIPTPAPVAWLWVDCEPDAPCVDELALREEMARFLARGLELAPIDADAFSDIAGSEYRGDINALAAAGLTSGCGPAEFCPGGNVTREQMATFIQRAFDLPLTTRDFFTDDEGSTHEAAINAAAAAGIAVECGPRLYCPQDFVTRGELASYLSRALDR